jgi:hypothetical protein
MKNFQIVLLLFLFIVSCNEKRELIDASDAILIDELLAKNQRLVQMFESIYGKGKHKLQFHQEITLVHQFTGEFIDSINSLNQEQAFQRAVSFAEKNFGDAGSLTRTSMPTKSSLKFYLAHLENEYIHQRVMVFQSGDVSFDRIEAFIIPEKNVVKKGESVRGKVMLVAVAQKWDQKTTIYLNGEKLQMSGSSAAFNYKPTRAFNSVITLEARVELENTILLPPKVSIMQLQ